MAGTLYIYIDVYIPGVVLAQTPLSLDSILTCTCSRELIEQIRMPMLHFLYKNHASQGPNPPAICIHGYKRVHT